MDMTESDNYIGIVNNNTDDNSCELEKEHMFDKVVTPSDVGKLNRLVIPKQHAERYFPLDDDNKSLILNFEDHSGNSWRFRYSYWTSSQSYVMTKGWSRFVKDKKLDAGYIVSFQRGVGEVGRGRLFIDARRRPDPTSSGRNFPYLPFVNPPPSLSPRWGRLYSSFPDTMSFLMPLQSHPLINYGFNHQQPELIGTAVGYYGHNVYLKSAAEEEAQSTATAIDPSPAAARTLRLFGVNMECSSSSSTHLGDQRPESSDKKGKASTSLDLDL